jgi:flavin-dependent dehydrogenase
MRIPHVVIVGGGPAGGAAAITLARLGLEVTVLEARHEARLKVGECLPPGANAIVEQLGLGGRLRAAGHLPSHGIRSVWGSSAPVERDFLFGTQGHGWHLDRLKFEDDLAEGARQEGARWRAGHRVVQCSRRERGWELVLESPSGHTSLEADFVVDATGRPARIARRFGARQLRHDRLIGAALLLKAPEGTGTEDSFTLVEAVPCGWWYSAPLPGDRLMIAYMSDSDLLDHGVRETGGLLTLQEEAEHTLRRVRQGCYRDLAGPRIQPAHTSRLDRVAGECWVAAGDAAAAFDPLSSYGISSAMGSGFYAASAVAESLAGDAGALPAYQNLLAEAFARYLSNHHASYSLEQRWPEELFWQRRHTRA